MTLLEAMADRNLFAPWFRDSTTWAAWRAFIAALFALPMTPEQLATYQQCTGRSAPPTQPATEAWLVCGRRAGKSFILALCAVFVACFFDYRRHLAPGERATVLIIATNSKQARVIFRYVRALLTHIPMLAKLIERETADSFDLNNGATIEVHPVSMKTTRGYTIVAALCDEIAFWPHEEAAEPDYEVLNALRPGMATIPNAMLLCASSPYARRGALCHEHRRHQGKNGDPDLVWRATTRAMNPTVAQQVIDAATEVDPASAASEYGAEFRSDIEGFVTREAVEACVALGVRERPPASGERYISFCDPSGGSADSMVCAVGHTDGDVLVVDAIREIRSPFDPESAVEEIAQLLALYNVSKTTGDRYSGQWCAQSFEKRSIKYEHSEQNKSQLYIEMLPRLNAKTIRLLDHPQAINQICMLERRTVRGGCDSIDHPPNTHDDIANAIAGLCGLAGTRRYRYDSSLSWVSDSDDDFQRQRLSQHILHFGGFYRQRR